MTMRYFREYDLRATLQAQSIPSNLTTALVSEAGREGHFIFATSDQSVVVTNDPGEAIAVPPLSDLSGASGAWVRAPFKEINVKWFGAKGDNSTSDTTAIQRAINFACYMGVGRIFFPRGIYVVTNLTLPVLYDPAGGIKIIEFVGETHPPSWFGTIGDFPLSEYGSILKSSSTGSLLRVLPNPGGGYDFSWYHLVVRDLLFRTYDNPNLIAINAHKAQHFTCERVQVDTGVYSVQAAEPTNNLAAIYTPAKDNGALTRLVDVSVSGYYTGIQANEHCRTEALNLTCNKIGVEIPESNHIMRIEGSFQRNATNVKVTGACRGSLVLNIEHAHASQVDENNDWQLTTYDVDDASNLGCLDVEWSTVLGTVGQDATFTVNGGSNLNSRRTGS